MKIIEQRLTRYLLDLSRGNVKVKVIIKEKILEQNYVSQPHSLNHSLSITKMVTKEE